MDGLIFAHSCARARLVGGRSRPGPWKRKAPSERGLIVGVATFSDDSGYPGRRPKITEQHPAPLFRPHRLRIRSGSCPWPWRQRPKADAPPGTNAAGIARSRAFPEFCLSGRTDQDNPPRNRQGLAQFIDRAAGEMDHIADADHATMEFIVSGMNSKVPVYPLYVMAFMASLLRFLTTP